MKRSKILWIAVIALLLPAILVAPSWDLITLCMIVAAEGLLVLIIFGLMKIFVRRKVAEGQA